MVSISCCFIVNVRLTWANLLKTNTQAYSVTMPVTKIKGFVKLTPAQNRLQTRKVPGKKQDDALNHSFSFLTYPCLAFLLNFCNHCKTFHWKKFLEHLFEKLPETLICLSLLKTPHFNHAPRFHLVLIKPPLSCINTCVFVLINRYSTGLFVCYVTHEKTELYETCFNKSPVKKHYFWLAILFTIVNILILFQNLPRKSFIQWMKMARATDTKIVYGYFPWNWAKSVDIVWKVVFTFIQFNGILYTLIKPVNSHLIL